MNNNIFLYRIILTSIIIGACLCCIFTSRVSAIDTNMTIANDTIILLFAFFLLSFGIYKEDSIIGFLSCFGSGFIFGCAIYNGLIDSELHTYIYIIIFLALGIGVYKVFLTLDDRKVTK